METEYRTLFGCDVGSLPFRYLGIPIYFRKLKNGEWKPVEDRFEKKNLAVGRVRCSPMVIV
jgi:hypothetical protein